VTNNPASMIEAVFDKEYDELIEDILTSIKELAGAFTHRRQTWWQPHPATGTEIPLPSPLYVWSENREYKGYMCLSGLSYVVLCDCPAPLRCSWSSVLPIQDVLKCWETHVINASNRALPSPGFFAYNFQYHAPAYSSLGLAYTLERYITASPGDDPFTGIVPRDNSNIQSLPTLLDSWLIEAPGESLGSPDHAQFRPNVGRPVSCEPTTNEPLPAVQHAENPLPGSGQSDTYGTTENTKKVPPSLSPNCIPCSGTLQEGVAYNVAMPDAPAMPGNVAMPSDVAMPDAPAMLGDVTLLDDVATPSDVTMPIASGDSLRWTVPGLGRARAGSPCSFLTGKGKFAYHNNNYIYQCTFCTHTSKTKSGWVRHEKEVHLRGARWICAPRGPIDARSGLCVYCEGTEANCGERCRQDLCQPQNNELHKSFSRKELLKKHLKGLHNTSWRPTFNFWNWAYNPPEESRCGFCGQKFKSWESRNNHLESEFKKGKRMEHWDGDWGFAAMWTKRLQGVIIPPSERRRPISTTRKSSDLLIVAGTYETTLPDVPFIVTSSSDYASSQQRAIRANIVEPNVEKVVR